MGKPPDKHDSTQPLTPSQIVTVSPGEPSDPNDRSVWKQVVVGADDFKVAPTKPSRTRLWILIGVLVAAAGGAAIYIATRGSSAPAPVDAAMAMATPPIDAVAIDAAVPDAAVDAPIDAPVDAPMDAPVDAPIDAGVPPKPLPKKPPPKKPPPKRSRR